MRRLKYVPTQDQIVHILTKALRRVKFENCKLNMGLRSFQELQYYIYMIFGQENG